ncbi:hypothetical protein MHYP_G00033310 [Metynnis hypsauchen]
MFSLKISCSGFCVRQHTYIEAQQAGPPSPPIPILIPIPSPSLYPLNLNQHLVPFQQIPQRTFCFFHSPPDSRVGRAEPRSVPGNKAGNRDPLTVLVLVTLLMVSVESDSSSTEEWKSLSNPKSRTLFFQMLQSYLDGREAQGGSRRMNMKEDRNSKMVNAAFDRYSNFLHSSVLDI